MPRFDQSRGEKPGVDWSTKSVSGMVQETQKPAVSAVRSLMPAGSAALTDHFAMSRLGPGKVSSSKGVPAEETRTWLRLTLLPMLAGLFGMMPKYAVRLPMNAFAVSMGMLKLLVAPFGAVRVTSVFGRKLTLQVPSILGPLTAGAFGAKNWVLFPGSLTFTRKYALAVPLGLLRIWMKITLGWVQSGTLSDPGGPARMNMWAWKLGLAGPGASLMVIENVTSSKPPTQLPMAVGE